MNANLSYTLDSLFGPPSDPINISAFLKSSPRTILNDGENFTTDTVNECSVEDVHNSSNEVWSNPALSGYLIKDHDRTVAALHAHGQKSAKAVRKANQPPQALSTEVVDLQKNLDNIMLNSYRLNTYAVLFMRTPKNSDQNILQTMKPASGTAKMAGEHEALLVISVYKKVSWSPSYVTRISQHAFISSQTLHDVYTAIPCVSRCFPPEAGIQERNTDCVICIESLAYSGAVENNRNNYTSELLQQFEISNKKGLNITDAPTSLESTKLTSLSLRTNEPYWLLHQGNCEHFLVVDEIRLLHPLDPRSGYPLILHITPPIIDVCRACARVPAVWSVVGDIRLGESPCVLCGPCWKNMGVSDDNKVVVLPLPEYTYCS